jgi:hypothetical protein
MYGVTLTYDSHVLYTFTSEGESLWLSEEPVSRARAPLFAWPARRERAHVLCVMTVPRRAWTRAHGASVGRR